MLKKNIFFPANCYLLLYKTSMLIRGKKNFKLTSGNEKKILYHMKKHFTQQLQYSGHSQNKIIMKKYMLTRTEKLCKNLTHFYVIFLFISFHYLIIFNKGNALVKFKVLVIVPHSLNYNDQVINRPRVTKAFQV